MSVSNGKLLLCTFSQQGLEDAIMYLKARKNQENAA